MKPLDGAVALVTGAGSGVGRAIAVALGGLGATVVLVGRDAARLHETADEVEASGGQAPSRPTDLTHDEAVRGLAEDLRRKYRQLDILVHSAGLFARGEIAVAPITDFDAQYRTNLRAPFLLTQHTLPLLEACRGQIVFINSSAGITAGPGISQYAATKHGLKALADSLRAEVNSKGIRVLSVYLGRTATPMQEYVHRLEGREYHPQQLIQPNDVASTVTSALLTPYTAEVTDLYIRPMRKIT